MTGQMFDEVNLITDRATFPLIQAETVAHNPPTTYGFRSGPGATLTGRAPLIFTERLRAVVAGVYVEPVTHRGLDIYLPIVVRVGAPDELLAAIETLVGAVDPIANTAIGAAAATISVETLRDGGSPGDERTQTGFVVSGVDQVAILDEDRTVARLPLIVRCTSPYWVGEEVTDSVDLETGGTLTRPASGEFLPWWPTFEIDGEIQTFTVTDTESGKEWTYDQGFGDQIESGETVVIVTQPGSQAVYDSAAPTVSLFGNLDAGSEFFPVYPVVGGHDLTVTAAGEAGSEIRMSAFDQYLTP